MLNPPSAPPTVARISALLGWFLTVWNFDKREQRIRVQGQIASMGRRCAGVGVGRSSGGATVTNQARFTARPSSVDMRDQTPPRRQGPANRGFPIFLIGGPRAGFVEVFGAPG